MKTEPKRIVESQGAPNENDLWLNGTTLKKFQNGEWVAISGDNSGGGDSSDGGCNCDLSDYVKLSDLIPTIEIDFTSPDDTEGGSSFWEVGFNGNKDIVSAVILKDTSSSNTVYCRITYNIFNEQVKSFYSDQSQSWFVQLNNPSYQVMYSPKVS